MPEPVAPHPAAPPEDAPRPADPPAARDPEQPKSEQSKSEQPKSEQSEPERAATGPAASGSVQADAETGQDTVEAAQADAGGGQARSEGQPGGSKDEPGGSEAEQKDGQDEAGQGEPRRSVARKVVGVVAALLAVGVVAALKFGLGGAVAAALDEDATAKAKAGDCLAELPDVAEGERKDARGAEVVACTSTEAVYTVVGRLDGQTEAQARTGEACEPFLQPGQAGYFFYNIKPGSTGYLLCLTRKAA
ncbi:LppU/SCO3897 family protein [Micromonospora haikouensis]|uniref:LppU/SCO3897 family protein n=1 Tax=Micromonospora haikouensis TaxID=686309 RepID=UPI003D75C7EA